MPEFSNADGNRHFYPSRKSTLLLQTVLRWLFESEDDMVPSPNLTDPSPFQLLPE